MRVQECNSQKGTNFGYNLRTCAGLKHIGLTREGLRMVLLPIGKAEEPVDACIISAAKGEKVKILLSTDKNDVTGTFNKEGFKDIKIIRLAKRLSKKD